MTFYRDNNSTNKMQELLGRITSWCEVICCCIANVLALLLVVLLKGTKLRKKKKKYVLVCFW